MTWQSVIDGPDTQGLYSAEAVSDIAGIIEPVGFDNTPENRERLAEHLRLAAEYTLRIRRAHDERPNPAKRRTQIKDLRHKADALAQAISNLNDAAKVDLAMASITEWDLGEEAEDEAETANPNSDYTAEFVGGLRVDLRQLARTLVHLIHLSESAIKLLPSGKGARYQHAIRWHVHYLMKIYHAHTGREPGLTRDAHKDGKTEGPFIDFALAALSPIHDDVTAEALGHLVVQLRREWRKTCPNLPD